MKAILILFSLILSENPVSSANSLQETEKSVKGKNNCILKTNDKRICLSENPIQENLTGPVNVDVTIGIVEITDIDDAHNNVEMTAWILVAWNSSLFQSQQNFSHKKYIKKGWEDKIWYPEMEIDRLIDLHLFKIERKPASKLSRYHFMQV